MITKNKLCCKCHCKYLCKNTVGLCDFGREKVIHDIIQPHCFRKFGFAKLITRLVTSCF